MFQQNATLRRYAHFPYLSVSRNFISSSGYSIDTVLKNPLYAHIRNSGKERVISALKHMDTGSRSTLSDEECISDILSFAVSRMIVAVIGDRFLSARTALAEAKSAFSLLRGEFSDMLLDVSKEYGMNPVPDDEAFRIHFTSFLRHSSKMRSPEWKLIYQDMRDGTVRIDRRRLARLVEQAIADDLMERLPPYDENIRQSLSREISEVLDVLDETRREFQQLGYGEVNFENFPPCMKEIMKQIRTSQNVPQMGRFAIVTFLHAIGMSAEQIFDIFSSVPDFKPEKTRYQIEHITGRISATEYAVPECSTMKSYGICFHPDTLCSKEWMKHPLTYYRVKGKYSKAPARKRAHGEEQ